MKRKPKPNSRFHDFLGLANRSFEQERLLVFHGTSGSGKSSNLKFLADHHPQFRTHETPWVWTMGKKFDASGLRDNRLVAVDEIISPLQFTALRKLLKTNQTVAVASHLHPLWFKLLGPTLPIRAFQTDRDCAKLRNYLDAKGVGYTEDALQMFCRRYRASYVELQCILERAPGQSLDQALRFNQKFDKISISKRREWTPVHPILKFD